MKNFYPLKDPTKEDEKTKKKFFLNYIFDKTSIQNTKRTQKIQQFKNPFTK